MDKKTSSATKPILAAAAAVLLLVLAAWIWRAPNHRVPEELVGQWHTSEANHADRSMDIDSVSINFGTGEGTVSTGFIKAVKAVPEGDKTLYTISYSTDEGLNEVSFFYSHEAANGKVIRFMNQQKIVWKKD